MNYTVKYFEELTNTELYLILKLRQEVFIIEQNCIYPDIDELDFCSLHILAFNGRELVAYCRIIPKGKKYPEFSIGRVVVSPEKRLSGEGRKLMNFALQHIQRKFQTKKIIITAQYHLKNFYRSLGFKQTSDIYLEDGIEHIQMETL